MPSLDVLGASVANLQTLPVTDEKLKHKWKRKSGHIRQGSGLVRWAHIPSLLLGRPPPLRFVVAKVELKIGHLNKVATTVGHRAFVGTFTYRIKNGSVNDEFT